MYVGLFLYASLFCTHCRPLFQLLEEGLCCRAHFHTALIKRNFFKKEQKKIKAILQTEKESTLNAVLEQFPNKIPNIKKSTH